MNDGTGGVSGIVEVWNSVILRLGRDITAPTSYYAARAGADLTPTLKIGAGNLLSVLLSGIANTATVTLYDNTTAAAPIIWSSGSMPSNALPMSIDLKNIAFYVGLSLGVTGANCNVTVIFE
jgi:hypothetical protein